MATLEIVKAEGTRRELILSLIPCGEDLCVSVVGGEKPHIGAVAYATPQPKTDKQFLHSATVSSICGVEHRDDYVARRIAVDMATELDCRVSVSAGIHIDDATQEEIEEIVNSCYQICHRAIQAILDQRDEQAELDDQDPGVVGESKVLDVGAPDD